MAGFATIFGVRFDPASCGWVDSVICSFWVCLDSALCGWYGHGACASISWLNVHQDLPKSGLISLSCLFVPTNQIHFLIPFCESLFCLGSDLKGNSKSFRSVTYFNFTGWIPARKKFNLTACHQCHGSWGSRKFPSHNPGQQFLVASLQEKFRKNGLRNAGKVGSDLHRLK